MADALVKRMDSARMERMLENALNTNEADFLSSASEITIEQVRRLRLGNEVSEQSPPKVQTKPPQPPKQKQPVFALNSFDFLLDDDTDAESWLVATPLGDARRVQLMSAPVEEKREVVGSPVDSSISSEISRSSCVTPASILETKHSRGETFEGFVVPRPGSAEPGLFGVKRRDIRTHSRSIGCIKHTPAPPIDAATARPPRKSLSNSSSEEESSKPKKTLGSKLKGRISSLTQRDSKQRPKSIGPVRRTKVSVSDPISRPKSSMGRVSEESKSRRSSKKTTSPVPRRPQSSLARPVSSLGTVKEEGSENKSLLGFRRRTSPVTRVRPQSSLGNTKTANKTKKAASSRITSPVPRPKSSFGFSRSGKATEKKSTGISRIASPPSIPRPKSSLSKTKIEPSIKRPTGISRIASPSARPSSSLGKPKVETKTTTSLLGRRKSTSSLPPGSQSSTRVSKDLTRSVGKPRLNKK